MKGSLRKVLLCSVLGFGSLMGVPMRAEEIEELMQSLSRPKVAETTPEEHDDSDWLTKLLKKK